MIYEIQGTPAEERLGGLGPHYLGFWVEGGYTFLFFSQAADEIVEPLVSGEPHLELRCVHHMKYEQWQDGAGFEPFSVGPLSIVPAWEEAPENAGPGLIRIDPGLAFGFGGHPTTRACLNLLVRVFQESPADRVLDLGAGTGILALAAARLGSERVRAVEYSSLAAETARANVDLNGLAHKIEVIKGLAEDHLDFEADLVCANLHRQVHETIMQKGGYEGRRSLIISGLFSSEADLVLDPLLDRGFRLVDLIRDERWTTALLGRKISPGLK